MYYIVLLVVLCQIEESNVKEFNMYKYLQITGIISDKDIRSVIITLTKKNNEPASVVITSMKFCEQPETQGILLVSKAVGMAFIYKFFISPVLTGIIQN